MHVTNPTCLSVQGKLFYYSKEKQPKCLIMVQSCLWRDKELCKAIELYSASGIDLHFEIRQKNSETPKKPPSPSPYPHLLPSPPRLSSAKQRYPCRQEREAEKGETTFFSLKNKHAARKAEDLERSCQTNHTP